MHNLFVYGTLRKNKYNNYLLKDEYYVGIGVTVEKYHLVINDLPYLIKEEVEQIEGDIYVVSDEKLKQLDKFEGHPIFYNREQIYVLHNNNILECYCYFYAGNIKNIREKML